jgi:hypothetical protein
MRKAEEPVGVRPEFAEANRRGAGSFSLTRVGPLGELWPHAEK